MRKAIAFIINQQMRIYLPCFLMLMLPFASFSQEIVNLNASWINLDVEMVWNDRVDMELAQSTRFNDLVGSFSVSNTTFKVSYELNKWLKTTAGYRYSYRVNKSRKFNRYQLALQTGTKWNDVKLSWRTRLEYKDAINRDNQTTRLRNKFSAGYKIKSIDVEPKIFVEYWYTFDEPLQDFSKYRIGISLSKEIVNRFDFKVGFNYDSDLNQDELERESIALLGLTYKFRRTKATN